MRLGRFGELSEPRRVLGCPSCGAKTLPEMIEDREAYYESAEYRRDVDDSAEVADYFRAHDPEQSRHLGVIGLETLRGAVVADVGCGAGSFLDSVAGVASRCVAVEPAAQFRPSLAERGYAAYPYAADALADWAGRVDVATSFAVIEHVEDPSGFLADVRGLLAPGGRLVLATPNADDALLEALPEDYPAFFYRKVHRWYFDGASVTRLLELAGFADVRIAYRQRFGLGNSLAWLRDRRPCGEVSFEFVTPAMEAAWCIELERSGRADFLYATATLGEGR